MRIAGAGAGALPGALAARDSRRDPSTGASARASASMDSAAQRSPNIDCRRNRWVRARAAVALTAMLAATLGAACAGHAPRSPATDAAPSTIVLDEMDDAGRWEAAPASGVRMSLSNDAGFDGGTSLRVDFDFGGGGGWAALRRALPVLLPENYELSFRIRGEAPENTLELKLIDGTGENVWWVNRPNFEFGGAWREVTFRRRHVEFAWGPLGGGEIRDVATIEFAITAGTGGRGTVWLDRIALTPREPVQPYDLTPVVTTTSGTGSEQILAGGAGGWRSGGGGEESVIIDFLRMREFGGLVLDWADGARAADYDVDVSQDGTGWQTVRSVRDGSGARDYLFLPEMESRWLRLRLLRPAETGYAIAHVAVQPLEWGASRNTLFETVAADAPRGHYPKYFNRVQSYWTVIGVNGAAEEAMINEEGMVEVGKRSFSIEPFLHDGERLLTWADVQVTQSLRDGYLPIPGVQWNGNGLRLDLTAWADGPRDASVLWLRYRVTNTASSAARPTLSLALRPFQVNPSWQFRNNPGGAAIIHDMRLAGDVVHAGDRVVVPVTRPAGFGAATFDEGGIMPALAAGTLPARQSVHDEFGHASAAFAYPLQLEPGESRDVVLAIPLTDGAAAGRPPARVANDADAAAVAQASLARAERAWRDDLERFEIVLPPHAPPLGDLVRSNLAWVLINRDGPSIQPGSRSYERSWIRDGSLTSAALLRLGHEQAVREFAEWYAPFQYADGKVPCCVDHRGADPVPEHDSHGQLIYLIAEYHRYTGDRAFAGRMWPHVEAAVAHIDSLRRSRMTETYRAGDLRAYYGLVPESISHEGYAAKPMHSYWDNFFVLKGLKDAAELADVLGRDADARRIGAMRDEFRRDLLNSFRLAMAMHGIDYLPGSVELGDFDATSTTVGITPAGEQHNLPADAVRATFERYWQHFATRRDGTREWQDYTPYELRTVGTFVRLGDRRRAHELLDWFMRDIRPRAWNHWAEVVWRDPAEPRFIGDMPHGWVGSDFIRSATEMFAYNRYADDALVIGAGILPEWLARGDTLVVRGLRTEYGTISYSMNLKGDAVEVRFSGSPRVPPGGIEVRSPLDRPLRAASADGRAVTRLDVTSDAVRLSAWPRQLLLRY
jgi:hypothetical protein